MRYWVILMAAVAEAAVQLNETFAQVKNFTNLNLQEDEVVYIAL